MSAALAGGFLTTVPPGKSLELNFKTAFINIFKSSREKLAIMNDHKEFQQRNGNGQREPNRNSKTEKYNSNENVT